MRIILMNVLLLMCTYALCGQTLADTIQIKRGYGVSFYQKNRKLSPKALLGITYSNLEAYKEMQIAKRNSDASGVISFIGGFLIGWPIGTALSGGEPEWKLAGIGAALIAITIPMTTAYRKHTIKAVHIYNDGLKEIGYNQTELKLNLVSNGIGIKMTF